MGELKTFPTCFVSPSCRRKHLQGLEDWHTFTWIMQQHFSLPVWGLAVSTELPIFPEALWSTSSFPQHLRINLWALANSAKNENLCGVDSTDEDWAENIPAQESNATGCRVLNLGYILSESSETHLSRQCKDLGVQVPEGPHPITWTLVACTEYPAPFLGQAQGGIFFKNCYREVSLTLK